MNEIPEPAGRNDNGPRTTDMDETKPYNFDSAPIDDSTRSLPLPPPDEARGEAGGESTDERI